MTGASTHVLEGHSDWVRSVSFSLDGVIASGSRDGTVRLWDTSTGISTHRIEGYMGWVDKVAFSPNGRTIAFSLLAGTVKLWDNTMSQIIGQYGVGFKAESLSFDHESRLLLGLAHSDNLENVAENENINIAIYSLDDSRQCMLYEGNTVFWLPVDCQPRTYDVYNNCVVLGSDSGRITFLCFGSGLPGLLRG